MIKLITLVIIQRWLLQLIFNRGIKISSKVENERIIAQIKRSRRKKGIAGYVEKNETKKLGLINV